MAIFDPQSNARRGYRQRDSRRRRKVQVRNESEDNMSQQPATNNNVSVDQKKSTPWGWIIGGCSAIAAVIIGFAAIFALWYFANRVMNRTTALSPASTEIVSTPAAKDSTCVNCAKSESDISPTPVPGGLDDSSSSDNGGMIGTSCKIETSKDGKEWVETGEHNDNEYGNRISTTNGRFLFPEKQPGEYTSAEIKTIEGTWLHYRISNCPDGHIMVFGTQFKHEKVYSGGIAFYLGHDNVEFQLKNGEVVVWLDFDDLRSDLRERMSREIEAGNLDVNGPLAFKFTSPEVQGFFPLDLINKRLVQVVDDPLK
jgi:hypothetical protein